MNFQSTVDQKETVREVYREIAAEYDERIPGYTELDRRFAEAERDFILRRLTRQDHVLELGCGTGRQTLYLAEHAGAVTALDMSAEMIEQARAKAGEAGVSPEFRQGDMTAIPLPGESFDIVVSMLALMHIPLAQRDDVFAEIARVLRPGGRLLLGVKNAVFERLSTADRFASVDVTDVANGELVFTDTHRGEELRAPWHSFSPEQLRHLSSRHGLLPTALHGNIPLSVWLDNSLLRDSDVLGAVRGLERTLADLAPLNELGYHLLFEAVKPLR
ncbi:ubiquinone/menaquinone biosynthesis C-methylase UbiE [Crossiella equi]|uniref:Ubiquinone/menaquinone biosynthesis C-methylase UbiE n=1 Tax=Crossiella equi TaxID=130796 RepID=A0ABS5A5Q5_9PSEU|nr:class I SAM-dependent methyltransferase [Crossiella equi]MBP2471582.1 ubiquinone/menaquinone biosynthesis C-methylase UbiE [Crossiella equi]